MKMGGDRQAPIALRQAKELPVPILNEHVQLGGKSLVGIEPAFSDSSVCTFSHYAD
jgi:hypothetical protein